MNQENYSYSLVERLSFVRYGGTLEELKAANILKEEIEKAGGHAELEEFKIAAYQIHTCKAKITSPYMQDLEVVPYGLSGDLPCGGADLKILYIERSREEDFNRMQDLSDTAVLVNMLDYDIYKILVKKHAAAVLVINSEKWHNSDENTDLVPRMLRPKMLSMGKVLGFVIRAKDATEMIRNEAETIHLELKQTECENTSRNVLAVIEGSEIKDESIVLTAHYDSVLVGKGSWDNATGSATLMSVYHYFLKNPPKRTMRFIWCGSEEQGLLGSKAYVASHEDLLDQIKFCFNFDMCGTVLGPNQIFVTGSEALKTYAEQLCNEKGHFADIKTIVHSSDSAPFCDKGIPAIGISRGTRTAEIHTRYDVLFPLSAKQLKKDAEFAVFFISRVVNSVVLPVPVGMPDEMQKKLDSYFQRDKN